METGQADPGAARVLSVGESVGVGHQHGTDVATFGGRHSSAVCKVQLIRIKETLLKRASRGSAASLLPSGLPGQDSPRGLQAVQWESVGLQRRRPGLDPWVGELPGTRNGQLTPRTEEPGGLQSTGSRRVGHD